MIVRALVEAAESLGISREELLQDSALSPADLVSSAMIPHAVIDSLVLRAVVLSGDEHFGLRWCEVCSLSSFGPLVYAISNAQSYRAGAAHMVASVARLGTPYQAREVGGAELHTLRVWGEVPNPIVYRVYVEATFDLLARLLRYCAGREGVARSLAFTFSAPGPAGVARYRQAFGCALRFDAEFCEMSVDNQLADRTSIHFDASFSSLLQSLASVPGAARAPQRVRWSELVAKFFASNPDAHMRSMDEVATALSVSERTLRRRLSEEGVRFPALAEQAMVRHAQTLLRDPALAIKAVAAQLGYSDASAFTRALRRCTGYAPSALRGARTLAISAAVLTA